MCGELVNYAGIVGESGTEKKKEERIQRQDARSKMIRGHSGIWDVGI